MDLTSIQQQLRDQHLDGWLFFDHHIRDRIAYRILGLEPGHVSRRWYYWIPAEGSPQKLVHRIESGKLDTLPGDKLEYSSWQEQQRLVGELVSDAKCIAMQYSENCMIPYISMVDGGTIELVRSTGTEIRSSAGLVQYFEARWSNEQYGMHLEAGNIVDQIRADAFELIGKTLRSAGEIGEIVVADFIREQFKARGLISADGPIVGVNANSGDPHYVPTAQNSSTIKKGDFVLIDLWAKLNQPNAVYYDVTWTGFCGTAIPPKIQEVFDVVTGSRDAALTFLNSAIEANDNIAGFEVDDVVRSYITDRGYGDAFVHRTGHSIGEEVHGNGANIDNLETHDTRAIIPGTCFSIEPGVYLQDFGVRSEIDCYVSDTEARATGEVQKEIVRIIE